LLAVGCWLIHIRNWLLAVGYWLLAVGGLMANGQKLTASNYLFCLILEIKLLICFCKMVS
ncbi:hypothetical protein, partial [Porphyromonas sp.]|uniref:hypothetical protein n=1 Tax=Porphyromonas sp. TaxID=1924944 RepID=UPI003AAE463D